MRWHQIAVAVLTLTAYLTCTYPMGVAAGTPNQFSLEIGKLEG